MNTTNDLGTTFERPLLELCEPPAGTIFTCGAWVTHDLSHDAVASLLAPTLVGVESSAPLRRRQEARAAENRQLLVFAAHDRVHGGPHLPWATIIRVKPPRLHAKFAVLQFKKEHSDEVITRAIVMSANLTRGGLTKNRELVVWEDFRGSRNDGTLATALIRELRVLQTESGLPTSNETITLLSRHAPKSATNEEIYSTVGTRRRLLAPLDHLGPVDEIVIVTPAFAGESSTGPAEALRPFVSSETRVSIYAEASSLTETSRSTSFDIPFSSTVLAELRKMAKEVRLFGVPRFVSHDRPDGLIERRLHAKMIALVKDEEARLLVGSANLTSPALNGDNRELMVEVLGTRTWLEELLESLDARAHSGSITTPGVTAPAADVEPLPEITARFEMDFGQRASSSQWVGTLFLEWDEGQPPSRLEYLCRPCEITEQQRFKLYETQSYLAVFFGDKRGTVEIAVVPPSVPGFWQALEPVDPVEARDVGFMRLLFDLRRASVGGRRGSAIAGERTKKASTDKFDLPLTQRLVLLARNRKRLNDWLSFGVLADALKEYIEDEAEHACAEALLHVYVAGFEVEDELLVAMSAAMHEFDAQGGRSR
jgi:hypothetical protein